MAALEIGLALPNVGDGADLARCRGVARRAVDAGIRSLWMTDHLLVGPEAAGSYGRVVEPLTGLAVLAGEFDDVALGTSILLLPLRNPVVVAKQAVLLQEATSGRFRLGVGVGWHQAEYDMLGVGFADRGGRTDESLELVQRLWRGASDFSGQRWAFDDAAFGPTPDPLPEVWVGGNAAAARRRARVHGDVWHPFMPDPGDVASFRAEGPTPVRPRLLLSFDPAGAGEHALAASPDGITAHLAALVGAGADGFVISLDPPPHVDGQGLRLLTERVLPALP